MSEARTVEACDKSPFSKVGTVEKTWGREIIQHSTGHFCSKLLVFDKKGGYFSLHYHSQKREEWTCVQGGFIVQYCSPASETYGKKVYDLEADLATTTLGVGDVFSVPPGLAHRVIATQDVSILLEVSTADDPSDSYRLVPSMPVLP